MTASEILTAIKTVDGSGSGLDADLLDGRNSSDYASIGGVSSSWQIGEKIYNVARCLFTGTPTEILIKTGIPFISGSHMPVIHIEGYAYGLQSPIELKIGYYVYGGVHGWCGVVSMGAWKPTIKLFTYLVGETKYTGIALNGSIYYPQFSVHVQTEMGGNYATGWSITSNMADNTIYYMPNTDVVTVPYKSTFSQKINGITFDGISDITIADSTKEPSFTKNTAFNKNFGTTAGTVTQGNDARLSDARTPTAHTHTSSNISDFASTVLSTVLSGLSTATNAVITATDSVLSALGKLQKQITDHLADTVKHITSTERTNWGIAYTHSQSAHAPTNAQKNSDITKAEIEAKLTGVITTHNHTVTKSEIIDFPTSLPANGGNADTAKHLVGDDTRSVNSDPSVYMSGGSRYAGRAGWQTEFKYISTIGAGSFLTGTYCYLETKTPWSDPSGGYPIQIAYGSGTPCWRIGTSTTAWSVWQALNSGGDAATVNGKTVAVSVPADAKFTDTNTITTINGKTGAITKADIVALGIPAQDTNTTYSVISEAEIDTGTATTGRLISAQRLKYITDKLSGINGAIDGGTF